MRVARRARLASLVAVAAIAVPAGLVVGTAGTASANAYCGKTAPDLDGGTWRATADGSNERSGSSTSCAIKGTAGPYDILDYHCYTHGSDGYTWTYVHNETDDIYGWIRDTGLSDGGSYVYCGF